MRRLSCCRGFGSHEVQRTASERVFVRATGDSKNEQWHLKVLMSASDISSIASVI